MTVEITALLLYNNGMEKTYESVAEWQALLAKKEDEIASLNRQVEWLTQQLRLTQRQRFGASSERTQVISEQFSLFNEAEELAQSKTAEPDLEQITYQRRKQAGKREMDFSRLPTEQVVHELPEEERVCPGCGGALHQCGQSVARRELLSNDILHADETTLMVLREPGRKAQQKSYGCTAHQGTPSIRWCCMTTSPAGPESVPAIS